MEASKTLLLIPISIMLVLGILGMTGLNETAIDLTNSNFNLDYINSAVETGNTNFYLYDYDGNPKCFINGTAYAEEGTLTEIWGQHPPNVAGWINATYTYHLYYDTAHYCPVLWQERNNDGVFVPNNGRMDAAGAGSFNVASSLGFIAAVSAIMAVGAIAGIRVLGSGESEFSVRLLTLGVAFLTFWGIMTYMSYPIILAGGFYIFIAYFVLTAMYCLGIILELGN